MPSKSSGPAVSPLAFHLMGGAVAFKRQTHEQLRATQAGPTARCRIQSGGESVRLGDEVALAGGWHGQS